MRGIVFDFDGVVVDSEVVANSVLAEALTALGHPTTLEDTIERYIGLQWRDACAAIEARIGAPLPEDFRERTRTAFQLRLDEVGAIEGLDTFLAAVPHLPKAIASSSRREWLELALARLGLADHFEGRLCSASEHVARGKPHPDIYLYAADRLGIPPAELLAIEDTPAGVTAARAAGLRVIGLCAGSHCGPGYADRLHAAGASHVAATYVEAPEIVRQLDA